MLYSNRESSIVGKDVTPFVLQRVNELTKGQSLQASILPLYNRFTCISFSIVALERRFAWNETSFIRTDSLSPTDFQLMMCMFSLFYHALNFIFVTRCTEECEVNTTFCGLWVLSIIIGRIVFRALRHVSCAFVWGVIIFFLWGGPITTKLSSLHVCYWYNYIHL